MQYQFQYLLVSSRGHRSLSVHEGSILSQDARHQAYDKLWPDYNEPPDVPREWLTACVSYNNRKGTSDLEGS